MSTETKNDRRPAAPLVWDRKAGRWHCDGKPIHAGANMELQFPDEEWVLVRIESHESGRILLAQVDFHCATLVYGLTHKSRLRWPAGK
jgi:hypothetical protein